MTRARLTILAAILAVGVILGAALSASPSAARPDWSRTFGAGQSSSGGGGIPCPKDPSDPTKKEICTNGSGWAWDRWYGCFISPTTAFEYSLFRHDYGEN